MLKFILGALWFMLPSYAANIIPVFAKKINLWNYPVDFGKTWKGKRIFGDHKTWRGIISGIVVAALLSFFQGRGTWVGIILGGGTLAGDLGGSFAKRRMSISPGGKSLIIDDIPGTLTGLVFAYAFGVATISFYQAAFLLLVGPPLHVLANRLWYALKIKEVPW
ncbi:hypothetical protein A2V54_00485 [candidate division WWE3 bacterium RBG_19FT_COMBO_53_11]|uniref:CDP-2,3-bis-(O-geranylgeranyl)-sn-glycerol synthase n=1 Tax=candidate division WWE3 bacterium RBG_19FT_COMBO_53_11 TaxID=1802613 RepID=A0A1F4UIE5_UNCKA|nr:MAG: hypothetical protein A2155_02170 [candidate division WWE3 bacterium RBG_16_52_45]OGC44689.1 MAG: hypothetical protein A2V54_00485 [candidate division WWE3 bacterium RBG_19FT_COMBO_53_11]